MSTMEKYNLLVRRIPPPGSDEQIYIVAEATFFTLEDALAARDDIRAKNTTIEGVCEYIITCVSDGGTQIVQKGAWYKPPKNNAVTELKN